METRQTPRDLGSGLHTVTPPRSPGRSKSHGHAPLPSLVEGVGQFTWQSAGLEGQNQVHNAPYPSLEAHLLESSFTALSPSQAVGEPGGPRPSPIRHPHNHAIPQHRIHPASSSHFQRRSVARQMFFIRFSRAFQRHVFSRSASLDTLRSQPRFCSLSFLRNSELSRSPFSHNDGSSSVPLLYLGWLWSFSNRGRGQGPKPHPPLLLC